MEGFCASPRWRKGTSWVHSGLCPEGHGYRGWELSVGHNRASQAEGSQSPGFPALTLPPLAGASSTCSPMWLKRCTRPGCWSSWSSLPLSLQGKCLPVQGQGQPVQCSIKGQALSVLTVDPPICVDAPHCLAGWEGRCPLLSWLWHSFLSFVSSRRLCPAVQSNFEATEELLNLRVGGFWAYFPPSQVLELPEAWCFRPRLCPLYPALG